MHRDNLRNARLFHGYPVKVVSRFHCCPAVSHHDELYVPSKLPEHPRKPVDVGFIESGVHLVEDTEGDGFIRKLANRRDRAVRAFSPPERRDIF